MEINKGIFAVKLYELERQYGMLRSRLQICQGGDREKLRRSIEALRDECRANDVMMQGKISGSKSPFVAELYQAQLSYDERTEGDITKLVSACKTPDARADAIALYAEFAIDFATQAMNHALLAAMYAVDAQISADEDEEEKA